MSFIHLHVYSAYSLLTSTASVEKLVLDAKKKGYKSIALTDRNVMYGAVSFYKQCLKHSIKPIIGLTVDVLSEQQKDKAFPLVLLAKNQTGYRNLMQLTTKAHLEGFYYKPRIDYDVLEKHSEGIICLSACGNC